MIIHGQINTAQSMTLDDGGKLVELRIVDKMKPSAFRTQGEFQLYLSEKARADLPKGDLCDVDVTVVCQSITNGKNGVVKLRGRVIPGIVPVDKIS